MRQSTLFDFTSRPNPVEGWMHERDGMGRQGWVIRAVDPTCIPEVACPDCAEAEL